MRINLLDPLVQIKITSAVCSFVAVGTSIFRLWIRRGRYWADDLWATLALLTLIIQIAAVFLHIPIPNSLSQTTRVAAYYLMAFTFYAVIWASRLSILFSLIRVDPSDTRRKHLQWGVVFFGLAAVFLMTQLLWVCEPEPKWKEAPNPQCQLGEQVAISQLVTDILADATLLFVPLRMFQSLQSAKLRKKLSIIFSTCVATTIVSLVHAALIFEDAGIKIVIAALVEDCISLIVANIPVVAAAYISLEEEDQISTYTGMSFVQQSKGVSEGGTFLPLKTRNTVSTGTSTTVTNKSIPGDEGEMYGDIEAGTRSRKGDLKDELHVLDSKDGHVVAEDKDGRRFSTDGRKKQLIS